MDEMVLLPTAGLEEEQTRVDVMPWLDRARLGTAKAWFSTVKMALLQPQQLMDLVPRRGSLGQALRFGTFSTALILAIGGVAILAAFLLPVVVSGPSDSVLWRIPVALAVAAGVLLLVVLGGLFLWTAASHVLLRLTGRTDQGMGRTCEALCYSSAANIFTGIPCLGLYFGWIWWLVSAVLMVKQGQRVHGGRAAFAVLTPPLTVVGGLVGLYVWVIASAISGATAALSVRTEEAQIVLDGLLDYVDQNADWPEHAISLVREGHLGEIDLVCAASPTSVKDVPVADSTLDQFVQAPVKEQEQIVDEAENAMPEDVVAHRLGDFVFTYHGIDSDDMDPGLWLVICSDDPALAKAPAPVAASVTVGTPGAQTTISSSEVLLVVGRADRTIRIVPAQTIQSELVDQNRLRARFGLPPLPDPTTILHGRPATSRATTQPSLEEVDETERKVDPDDPD